MAAPPPRASSIATKLTGLLSPDGALLYARALEAPQSVDPTTSAARELITLGLVRVAEPAGAIHALPPEAALTRLLHAATEQWLASAPNFDGVLRTINRLAASSPEPFIDPDGIDDPVLRQQTIERLLVDAQTSVWCIQPYPEWIPEDELADQSTWTRNHQTAPTRVSYRYVYDQKLLKFPKMHEVALEEIAEGCEIRIANWYLPTFMMTVDGRVGLYFPDRTGPGKLTDDEGEVGLLCLAFETAFARAVPLVSEPELSSMHQQIHTFLALGHSTRAIGSLLQLNERTVRRRVNELMEHYGVTSRRGLASIAASGNPRPSTPSTAETS